MANPYLDNNPYLNLPGDNSLDNHENILQKVAKIATETATRQMNPIVSSMVNPPFGIKPEDTAPSLGQVAGGAVGGFPGAVIGEGAGEGVRQLGKLGRGEEPTPQDIPIGMGITAATEGIPRAAFNSYFGRQIATKTMEKLGQAIGAVKNALATDPTATVPSGPIVQKLESIYNGIKEPLKNQASHLKDWIEHFKSNPVAHATDLQQMEDSFGAYSKYGTYENGAFQPPKSTEPVINAATKKARDVVSSAHDNLAVSKGFNEFPSQNKEFSGYKQRWKDINPAKDKAGTFGKLAIAGAAEGASMGHGLPHVVPFATTLAVENILTNPAFKGAAFNVISNPLVNAALSGGRLAGAELGRDVVRK